MTDFASGELFRKKAQKIESTGKPPALYYGSLEPVTQSTGSWRVLSKLNLATIMWYVSKQESLRKKLKK
jgi:hypothetical protein